MCCNVRTTRPKRQNRSMATSYPRIGYAPYSSDFKHPGDRRRFVAYPRARNLPFEIARPSEKYDVVILSEVADISFWSDYKHGKVIYDLIDSYLAIPSLDPKQMLRGLVWYASGRHQRLCLNFKAAIERQCRRADAVVCTTDEQKQEILALSPNVHVILDIHDAVVGHTKQDYGHNGTFNLVWEGLPSNLGQLKTIGPALRELSRGKPISLNIVTDPARPWLLDRFGSINSLDFARKFFDNVVFHKWDEATCSAIITECDVAVIPINLQDPLAIGKSANKLLLLWHMAMPVVTSATPAYLRMQRAAGLADLACSDNSDWVATLERLMTWEAKRQEAGQRGHRLAAERYNTNLLLARWDAAFSSIGFNFNEPAGK
jgi:glycosyltransferase involved in cell wall biosynthesis